MDGEKGTAASRARTYPGPQWSPERGLSSMPMDARPSSREAVSLWSWECGEEIREMKEVYLCFFFYTYFTMFLFIVCLCTCTHMYAYTYMCIRVTHTHVCMHVYVSSNVSKLHTWRSENNLKESALSFHYVGPRNWTQIVSLGDKSFYPLSYFAGSVDTYELYVTSYFNMICYNNRPCHLWLSCHRDEFPDCF